MYSGDHLGLTAAGNAAPPPRTISERVRSRGEIDMSFACVDAKTALFRSFQSGCLRLRVPRRMEGDRPCAVLINTSGGLAEGDRLSQRIAWEKGSRAVVSTQAAEKVYRALATGCEIETRIDVAAGAGIGALVLALAGRAGQGPDDGPDGGQ